MFWSNSGDSFFNTVTSEANYQIDGNRIRRADGEIVCQVDGDYLRDFFGNKLGEFQYGRLEMNDGEQITGESDKMKLARAVAIRRNM